MKKNILLVMSFTLEVEDDYLEQDLPSYTKIENKVIDTFEKDTGLSSISTLGWESSYVIELNENYVNCGRCAVCNSWVTDREKADPVPQLCNGATYKGELLCDEHLPKGHKWAF